MAEVVEEKSSLSHGRKSITSLPTSKDTLCQKVALVSFWFAIFTPGVVEAVYKNTLYIDFYGANPAAYATFTLIFAAWGAAANVYVGQFIDQIQPLPGLFPPERWGRRAPWALIFMPLYMLLTFLAFNPFVSGTAQLKRVATACSTVTYAANETAPSCETLIAATSGGSNNEFKAGGLEIYFFIVMLCYVHVQNGLYQTFFASIPELYSNPHERAQVGGYLGVFSNTNALLIVLLVAFVFMKDQFNGIGVFITCAIFLLLTFYPGLVQLKRANFKQRHMGGFLTNLKSLCKSKAIRIYLLSQLLHTFSNIGTLVILIFWMTRVVGLCVATASQLVGIAALARLFLGIMTIPCWNALLTKAKIHPRVSVAAAYIIGSTLGMLVLQMKTPLSLFISAAMTGIVYAQNNLTNRQFVGWMVDDDTRIRYKEDGKIVRREALIQGTVSALSNLAYFWGGILLTLLASSGYNGALPTRCLPQSSLDYIHFAFTILNQLIGILRGVVIFFFPIYGKTMEELETELKEINSKSEKHFTDVNNVKIENTDDAKNFELPKD
jgi:Na+/melibiose symporter-like transporter